MLAVSRLLHRNPPAPALNLALKLKSVKCPFG
nr:MAG TPA_asm: hypothetical protein [Caudoviricetes sp.]